MKRIGLLSDTHSYLDPTILVHFAECDEVWHAGDIGSEAVADQLEAIKPFRAVYGNIDGGPLRRRYSEDLLFTCEGVKVFITHIGGYPGKYPARIKQILQEERPGLFICGHSHILKVMPDRVYHLLHINPGACGREGFHRMNTVVRFSLDLGQVKDLEVIELGLRGKIDVL
jgi:uncharacterized protein